MAELIQLCGRLPLALAVVAARAALSSWPLDVLAGQLADADDRLEELGLDDPRSDVRAVFSWSSRQLGDEAARMFRQLAIHPGPDISVLAAANLARIPVSRAMAALRELAAANLAIERVPGRYVVHDLIRAYAVSQGFGAISPTGHANRASSWDEEREAAASAMVDHYVHAATSAARVLDPGVPALPEPPATGVVSEEVSGIDQALAWFDAERKVLLAVVKQAAAVGAGKRVGQLAGAFEPFCARRSYWADLAAMQRVALEYSDRLSDLAGQAQAHLSLSRALGRLGPADTALMHVAIAIELASALGDQATEARGYLMLAHIRSDPAEAIGSCQRALQLAESAGSTALMAHACNNLGYDYALDGDPEQALEYCQRALSLCRIAETDPALEGHIHDSLGLIYLGFGDRRQAFASYTRAVRRFRAIGALHLGADSLERLGDCHATAGNVMAAVDAWQQALVLLDELGHPDAGQIRRKLSEHARLTGNGTRPGI